MFFHKHLELKRFLLNYAASLNRTGMLIFQDCIKKLADFKATFSQKYGITKLGIFGSVARKENTEGSDIDIVVEVEKPSLKLMYELKETLKALFACEVDLVRFKDSLHLQQQTGNANDFEEQGDAEVDDDTAPKMAGAPSQDTKDIASDDG